MHTKIEGSDPELVVLSKGTLERLMLQAGREPLSPEEILAMLRTVEELKPGPTTHLANLLALVGFDDVVRANKGKRLQLSVTLMASMDDERVMVFEKTEVQEL